MQKTCEQAGSRKNSETTLINGSNTEFSSNEKYQIC